MYCFDEMIEMGLEEGQDWTSDVHREVAVCVCIGNPAVHTMDALKGNVQIINGIPQEDIKKVTLSDLMKLGCVVI